MAFIRLNTKRWPGGVVPFAVDGLLSSSPTAMAGIQGGMSAWTNAVPQLQFIPYIPFAHQNWIRFAVSFYTRPGFCSSPVGMQGGEQRIRCSPLSVTGLSVGLISHEVGHALGLNHEHQRPDRDDVMNFNAFLAYYVAGRSPVDFKKLLPPWNLPYGDYDCSSVMHYRRQTVNGMPYLASKDRTCATQMELNTISAGDAAATSDLY